MKVSAVTPTAAASDPAHPDHESWVKDTTLKMEMEHAKRVGISTRDAEAENARMLERSARIAADATPAKKKGKPAAVTPNMGHAQRKKQRGVTTRFAKPEISLLKLSPCGRCGVCRNCMRERRVLLIVQKRKDDAFLRALSDSLFMFTLRASGGFGEFKFLSKRDIDRAITAKAEETCNLSIPRLGEWRK